MVLTIVCRDTINCKDTIVLCNGAQVNNQYGYCTKCVSNHFLPHCNWNITHTFRGVVSEVRAILLWLFQVN